MKTGLKITLWLTFIIVMITGFGILLGGPSSVPGVDTVTTISDVDSELRFLAVFWLAYGFFALWVTLNLDARHRFVPAIAIALAAAAGARIVSLLAAGRPNDTLLIAIVLELIIAGLIYSFYTRVRRRHTR